MKKQIPGRARALLNRREVLKRSFASVIAVSAEILGLTYEGPGRFITGFSG